MNKILYNIALIDTLTYCKNNNIDCSGTHIYKYPRKYIYSLIRDKDGFAIITVQYYKNHVPTYFINNTK